MLIIGVDTGGTFTDLICWDQGRFLTHKLLSTPDDPARAVLQGLAALGDKIGRKSPRRIVHGSTVATNAILERKGVKTALFTNKGFEDVLVIGRQNRSRLYDLAFARPRPLAPDDLRLGLPGRVLHSGEEEEPFDREEAAKVMEKLRGQGVESVAICFLFSFVRPEHENAAADLVREILGDVPVSLSHRILSEFREYERMSTTCVNAYVSPKMDKYIGRIEVGIESSDSLRVMQSNGGSISAATARAESVRTILSGPAGGAVGACEVARLAGFNRCVAFDMGGTSTDVCLIDGQPGLTLEAEIAGCPVKTPMIDIHTVGAGGGSIASMDSGGGLCVGPESAGADPGPICYGQGRRITVTDANLFLGRLRPEYFLGGGMRLKTERLEHHFTKMAAEFGLSPLELAEGVIEVANANMERAVRVISVERGHDPREFTLVSFGGAGGLHAAELARLLSIPRVLFPANPGVLSALGMLLADVVKDYSRTVMLEGSAVSRQELEQLFLPLEREAQSDLAAEGVAPRATTLGRFLDMRYQGQSYEMIVPLEKNFIEAFHQAHQKTYGYRNPDKPVEIVNIRLRASGAPQKPSFEKLPLEGPRPDEAAVLGQARVVFQGRETASMILDRAGLKPGDEIQGPAVIVEYSSTLLVPPGALVRADEYLNLVMRVN